MNILFLYNSTQTYTNTVYEHVASFRLYSKHNIFYTHVDQTVGLGFDIKCFDAICIHYSVRLPFDHLSETLAYAIQEFKGIKFLFIQDEYDNTKRAWHWIRRLSLHLVFTVAPGSSIPKVYPAEEFPNTEFVSVLTGYVPEFLPKVENLSLPSKRPLMIGYRGRPLPIRYGSLSLDKVNIGKITKTYCELNNIPADIAWSEESRIYGADWYTFVGKCRSMLGSESASNVFDWDGDLQRTIDEYKNHNPKAGEYEIYLNVVRPQEIDGLMNMVSPRIFEAIAMKTLLVLFEGNYSGVIKPWEHYIPLKKDGSNLDHVFEIINDEDRVDQITKSAYSYVIESGNFSYRKFVSMVDDLLDSKASKIVIDSSEKERKMYSTNLYTQPASITTVPIRFKLDSSIGNQQNIINPSSVVEFWSLLKKRCIYLPFKILYVVWGLLPNRVQAMSRPYLRSIKWKLKNFYATR